MSGFPRALPARPGERSKPAPAPVKHPEAQRQAEETVARQLSAREKAEEAWALEVGGSRSRVLHRLEVLAHRAMALQARVLAGEFSEDGRGVKERLTVANQVLIQFRMLTGKEKPAGKAGREDASGEPEDAGVLQELADRLG